MIVSLRHLLGRRVSAFHSGEDLWLAMIPYIRRINNLRDCLHSAHFVKILRCLRAFDICSVRLSDTHRYR